VHIIGAQRPAYPWRDGPDVARSGRCRDFVAIEQAMAYFDSIARIAVLATALALLGFSVVAAILLMRTRLRAARNEARLRSDITDLQIQADRLRALLFAEPQVLISWAAVTIARGSAATLRF